MKHLTFLILLASLLTACITISPSRERAVMVAVWGTGVPNTSHSGDVKLERELSPTLHLETSRMARGPDWSHVAHSLPNSGQARLICFDTTNMVDGEAVATRDEIVPMPLLSEPCRPAGVLIFDELVIIP